MLRFFLCVYVCFKKSFASTHEHRIFLLSILNLMHNIHFLLLSFLSPCVSGRSNGWIYPFLSGQHNTNACVCCVTLICTGFSLLLLLFVCRFFPTTRRILLLRLLLLLLKNASHTYVSACVPSSFSISYFSSLLLLANIQQNAASVEMLLAT